MSGTKVLMLNRSFSLTGGVPRVLLTYARYRDPERVNLQMASMKPFAPAMAEAFRQAGVPIHQIGDLGYWRSARALRTILKTHAIQVVVAASLRSYLTAKLAAPAGCRVVYWIHGIATVTEDRLKTALWHWVARRDTFIFISESAACAHRYASHRGREVVVLNGVEDFLLQAPPYDKGYRAKLGIPENAFVFGYTAEFIEWKQHRTLLTAFAKLASEHPGLHLVLIGVGSLLEQMRAASSAITGGERIHFLGVRQDARQLLGIMDVYVHPSNGEGFGLAVVEAMLARRPVVVSDAGALPEIVIDGKTGLVCRGGDANDLAAKMTQLMSDPPLREKLGEQARAAALERFGAKRFAGQITTVLEVEVRAVAHS